MVKGLSSYSGFLHHYVSRLYTYLPLLNPLFLAPVKHTSLHHGTYVVLHDQTLYFMTDSCFESSYLSIASLPVEV